MTQSNYTHLVLVVDRSGSMHSSRVEAQDGINTLLKEQFAEPGKLTVTITEFDGTVNPVERLAAHPVEYTLEPRGNTALLDAVGLEIQSTGQDLAGLPENERPERVLFVVVTDGQENASRQFTFETISSMIQHQQEAYGWDFQYIGPAASAWQGERLQMRTSRNSGSARGVSKSWEALDRSMKTYRSASSKQEFLMEDDILDD